MKRFTVLLLAALLILASCSALSERSLMNPQEQYDHFVKESDGSEQMLYTMVDMVNDEETLVQQDGSVLVRQHFVMNDGQTSVDYMTVETRLFLCDFGRVVQMTVLVDGEVLGEIFSTENYSYQLSDSGSIEISAPAMSADDFNGTWENWVFPYYTPLEVLNGMREDGKGTMYFIVSSDEGDSLLEYVVSQDGMVLLGVNHYVRSDEGDDNYYLWLYTEVIRGEGAALPQSFLDAMSTNEVKTAADNPA